MYLLGISAYYHDSAAALIKDGQIIAAAQEERFTRKKHDSVFPSNAVQYCLREAGLILNQVSNVVFYDKPFVKFERLLETYLACAPQGLRSFTMAMPVWLKEKLFLDSMLRKELVQLSGLSKKKIPKLLFGEHHQSHAASAFFPSPFERETFAKFWSDLGDFVSHVFFIFVVPIALMMRITKRDSLTRAYDLKAKTYRILRKDGDTIGKRMERLF